MKKILFLSLFAAVTLLSACQQAGTTISGKINGAANLEGILEETMLSQVLTMQKNTFDGSGNFKFTLPNGLKPGVYRIKIGMRQLNIISNGKEKNVKIEADLAGLETGKYTVSGSEDTENYVKIIAEAASKAKSTDDIKKMIEEAKNPLLSMVLSLQVQDLMKNEYMSVYKSVSERLNKDFPGTPYARDYDGVVVKLQNMLAMQEVGAGGISVGQPAPEIALPNPDGKVLKLSALKGKVVLLDFWASWCGPCRRANPSVVSVYNRFKDKGFVVFNVSLDKDRQKWVDAIKQDGLNWEYHVSDLKFWSSQAAQLYQVNAIPQQFLIGRDGKIAAVSQAGMSLEGEIEKLMN